MSMLALRKTNHFFRSFLLKALPASIYYGFPGRKLKIYGITGTDGKTTSSTLLYHVLQKAGYKTALISTVAAFIGDKEIDTGFHVTSPEPVQIQQLLDRCVREGIEHVVLEVTSHGYFQYRTWGIPFALAGLTNISPEHLDYFETYEKYARAKADFLLSAQVAVINESDQSFSLMRRWFNQAGRKWVGYEQELNDSPADKAIGARFATEPFNQWNAKLVEAMVRELGISAEVFMTAIAEFSGVTGRMQTIPNDRGIHIVVDFAHTPNGLEQSLTALRSKAKKRLIAVYGCAGLRDRVKRAPMGRIGTQLADLCIFTSEDPRTEDVQVIIRQMKEGVEAPNHRKVVTIADRRSAIEFALAQAKPGDYVGIFGKGHEKSINIGGKEYPWSDQQVVAEILAQ